MFWNSMANCLGKIVKNLFFLHICFVFYFDFYLGVINKTCLLIRHFRRNCWSKLFQSYISTEIITPSSMVMFKPNKTKPNLLFEIPSKMYVNTNQMLQMMGMLMKDATKCVWINKYVPVVFVCVAHLMWPIIWYA